MSSFAQLEVISSRGEYHVGCLKDSSSSPQSVLTAEDCVKLVIEAEGEESAGSGKVYSLSDLHNLQSKLMLISGRGDECKTHQVDVFVDVRIIVLHTVCQLYCCLLRSLISQLPWRTFILN